MHECDKEMAMGTTESTILQLQVGFSKSHSSYFKSNSTTNKSTYGYGIFPIFLFLQITSDNCDQSL